MNKTQKGLEACSGERRGCPTCPYNGDPLCRKSLAADALELVKGLLDVNAQLAVENENLINGLKTLLGRTQTDTILISVDVNKGE